MKTTECLERLKTKLATPEVQRSPEAALAVVVELYRTMRADDCELEADGDMLLFQWGTYGHRDGTPQFELDLTRQFMPAHEDAALTQLCLTFLFAATPELTALGEGDRWCPKPEDLDAFAAYVRASPAFAATKALRPASVLVEQEDL